MPLENCELHASVPHQDVAFAMNRNRDRRRRGTTAQLRAVLCAVDRKLETPVRQRHINVLLCSSAGPGVWSFLRATYAREHLDATMGSFIAFCSPRYPRAPVLYYVTFIPFLTRYTRSHSR